MRWLEQGCEHILNKYCQITLQWGGSNFHSPETKPEFLFKSFFPMSIIITDKIYALGCWKSEKNRYFVLILISFLIMILDFWLTLLATRVFLMKYLFMPDAVSKFECLSCSYYFNIYKLSVLTHCLYIIWKCLYTLFAF